jgi:arabinogalactan oligomer/maltooligosaccharide transport system substrate-binding protein
MNKKAFWLIVALLFAVFMLSACGTATTATTAATEAPTAAKTEAPAPAETQAPAATAEPVTIVVWHGYTETEEAAFSEAVDAFMAANPNVTVNTLAVPFDELQNKFQTEAASGGGPTLITGPQDRMAAYADAGLLAELPADASFWADLVPASVDGWKVAGVQVGVPLNNKVLALFYNKSMVDTPPETFDELLSMAADGKKLALTADWFHNYMWLPAFGAKLFDDNLKAVIDSPEGAKALAYYKSVCDSDGVTCDGNDGDMDTLFRTGEAAFRVQGPWMSGDAIKDLGVDNVGVAKIPGIPDASDPRPWNQSEMASINANATDAEKTAALELIGYLVGADAQAKFLNEANWIPANSKVDTSGNPVVGGFLAQVPFSDPFPVVAELGATWDPMGNAVTKILEGVSSPEDALKEAAGLINTTNKK